MLSPATLAERPEIHLAGGGGGPAGTFYAGGFAAADAACKIVSVSASSISTALGAGLAFGVPHERTRDTLVDALEGARVLDPGVDALGRGGILKWEKISAMIREMIGPRATLGEATIDLTIGVTDLDRARTLWLSKRDTPHVLVHEAVSAACAVLCGVAPACLIPSLSTSKFSPDIRLFGDTGWIDNTTDGVRDDGDAPPVLLCLEPDTEAHRVREGDVPAIFKAMARAALVAQSLPKTRRSDGVTISVGGRNDWDFSKNRKQVEREWSVGFDHVRAGLREWIALRATPLHKQLREAEAEKNRVLRALRAAV